MTKGGSLGSLTARIDRLLSERAILLNRIEELEEGLRDVANLAYGLPGGVDEDAEWDDPSPVNAVGHQGGLIVRAIRELLEEGDGQEGPSS